MAITPGPGYMVDPNNSNGVIPIPVNPNNPMGTPVAPKKPDTGIYPVYTPPAEPSIVSSANISDNVIPENNQKLDQYSQKGTYVLDGSTYYANGSLVPAPVGATYNPKTGSWESGGTSYGAGPQYIGNPDNDPDIASENAILSSLKAQGDASLVDTVSGIEGQYDALRSEAEAANAAASQSRARTLLMAGTSRYSPLTASGQMLSQANYGLKQIQSLDASENNAIATAKAAQAANNMKLMDTALSEIQRIRQAKTDAAAKVNAQLQTALEDQQKKTQQAQLDGAVSALLQNGITDPALMLAAINKNGATYSAADVAQSIKNLAPTSTAKDVYKFSNADVGKLLAANLTGDQIQAVQDYYNGRGNPPSLTEAQAAALQGVLSGKVQASPDTGAASVSWSQYLAAAEAEMRMSINPDSETYKQLKQQYTQTVGASVGKLTPTEKTALARAGLSDANAAVQAYFLSTPASFQDAYVRDALSGGGSASTLDDIHKAYEDWTQASGGSSSGEADVTSLLNQLSSE